MHQTGLASFDILEEWNNLLFSTILREPPSGYQYVSIQQILAADKFYWTRVAQETRGQLQIVAGAPPPLDQKVEGLYVCTRCCKPHDFSSISKELER